MAQSQYLRLSKVIEKTGLSRATLYRKMADGSFPGSYRIGDRAVGWRNEDFEDWYANPDSYRQAKT